MNTNRDRYENPSVVDFYANLKSLEVAERFLFDKYLKRGMKILDIGVGAGRTTPYLSAIASLYVGVENSYHMLDVCRRRFPRLSFVRADASDLGMFVDDSFDAVVFSFNGIDYIETDLSRKNFWAHCNRITTVDGCLIFSCHNAGY